MAKMYTPAMAAYNKKHKKARAYSVIREAWRRFSRNKTAVAGLIILCCLVFCAIFANFIAPYEFQEQIVSDAYQVPSVKHIFGTDHLGRDLFSRCIYGARYSLLLSVISVITGTMVGGMLGLVAGYFGGKADEIIMRIMDVFSSIPSVLLAISIASALGNGVPQLITAITISSMPRMAKNFRSAILGVKTAEYVESSRAIGVKKTRMICKHMVPNAVGVLVIYVIQMMSTSIGIIASLSYLGVGLNPPAAEWGLILSDAKGFFTAFPHMLLFPALMIMITVTSLNMIGDGLRDAFDPRLK